MSLITIVIIGLGLSMDAFAVSIASGVIITKQRFYHALRFGIFFGLFQMGMPIIGWISGVHLRSILLAFDHWIAFGLLAFIGSKMIYEAVKFEEAEQVDRSHTTVVLLGLAIATSIDALAVGLSFAFLGVDIIFPACIIGIITFGMSYAGFYIGNTFGHVFEKKAEIAGGIVLVLIGIWILAGHLFLK